ncbi:MAG TPA: UDP-N-acetylmuramoyl-L-alanine--D-glutamate ligase [Candidatus Polarisedimenticolaceae bacterium]|nr:UDP-N-acetylmuramoyl-L-alanine--D-glutamate ligase [Candidatus Polarisedimenticolaceae bacterium]
MRTSIGADTRAAVFGYGVEGRAALGWLLRSGARARVIAPRRPDDLDAAVPWAPETDVEAALGGRDILVKSPGIKPSHPIVVEARRRGLAVVSATSLFVDRARAAGIAVVGVTGSKGKSTTATLIHRTLTAAGVPSVLVGNIGRCALDILEEVVSARPVVVFEMSSYQTHDLNEGPSVAVISRLFPEHLDWHGGVEAYYEAKLRVARTQRPDDLTIYNAADPELARRAPLGPARHRAVGTGPLRFSDERMRLRGAHNRINAALAHAAAENFGAGRAHLEEVLASFEGLPHRLEDLGVHRGVRWINDSIATAPEAAVAALEALGDEVATYIGGGLDRGYDFAPLARELVARGIPNVIVIPPGGGRIVEAIAAIAPRAAASAHAAADLAEAVALAAKLTPPGKTVLFSPASPSYGTFRNFEERGELFRAMVRGKETS